MRSSKSFTFSDTLLFNHPTAQEEMSPINRELPQIGPPDYDSTNVDLSISIVNTDNRELLLGCLESIYSQDQGIEFEVLVVDNSSTDGSVEEVRRRYPKVVLSVNDERKSYAVNNNINLRLGTGRYLMLLNDDTIVFPGTLKAHVDFLDQNPEFGGTGGKMLNPDETLQLSCARSLPRLRYELYDLLNLSDRYPDSRFFGAMRYGWWDHSATRTIELPGEANAVLRREVLEETGLFDETFSIILGEGPDLYRRVRDAGYRVMFLPHASVIHFGGKTTQHMITSTLIRSRENEWRYYRYNDGMLVAAVYRLMVVIFGVVMVCVASLRGAVVHWSWKRIAEGVRGQWTSIRWALGLTDL